MNRFNDAAIELAQHGWTVLTDFLPPENISSLRAETLQLWQKQDFRPAGTGRLGGYAIRPNIRGDHIHWLEENNLTESQAVYWKTIEELREELNRELFLSLASFEAHFAVYQPGASYQKHLDRFNNADERAISSTLYLNDNWKEEFGGQLRLYTRDRHIDVFPDAGTCVLFRSDTFFHEVLPATETRYSLTGWFRRRSTKAL